MRTSFELGQISGSTEIHNCSLICPFRGGNQDPLPIITQHLCRLQPQSQAAHRTRWLAAPVTPAGTSHTQPAPVTAGWHRCRGALERVTLSHPAASGLGPPRPCLLSPPLPHHRISPHQRSDPDSHPVRLPKLTLRQPRRPIAEHAKGRGSHKPQATPACCPWPPQTGFKPQE